MEGGRVGGREGGKEERKEGGREGSELRKQHGFGTTHIF